MSDIIIEAHPVLSIYQYPRVPHHLRSCAPLPFTAQEPVQNGQEPLRPCPFCGGEAVLNFDDLRFYSIECHECGIRTRSTLNKYLLIRDWNHRTSDPQIALLEYHISVLEKRIENYDN